MLKTILQKNKLRRIQSDGFQRFELLERYIAIPAIAEALFSYRRAT